MNTDSIERFDIRLPASAKHLLLKAAEINGSTLSALVLGAAMDKAREILQAHQLLVLNAEDWQAFVHTLENAPDPNAALKQAWADYQVSELE